MPGELLRDAPCKFDLLLTAENPPEAVRLLEQTMGGFHESLRRPAFGRAVLCAGVEPKQSDGLDRAEALADRADLTRIDGERRWNGCRIGSELLHEKQIIQNLVTA